MGVDNTSAPEEVRKCWLKVTLNTKPSTRMIEWSTAWTSFKDMDAKVRRMFGLNDKIKLQYTYEQAALDGDITMSSDEELSTAIQLMLVDTSILIVNVSIDKKNRKSPFRRLLIAARAQQPNVAQFLATIPTAVRTHVSVAPFSAMTQQVRDFAATRLRCQRNNAPGAPNHRCRARPRLLLGLFVLLLAVMFAPKCYNYMSRNDWHSHFHNYFIQYASHGAHNGPATILAATYGGQIVTHKLQQYYNLHGVVVASNELFGDTAFGMRKHLHVIYQHIGSHGISEVFSQTFPESYTSHTLALERSKCAFPEEAIVDGSLVKVLGALYDEVVATCAVRRFASTGKFTLHEKHGDAFIRRGHFGSASSQLQPGKLTLVYLKNNVLNVKTVQEGSYLAF